jgi:hypothetical protein
MPIAKKNGVESTAFQFLTLFHSIFLLQQHTYIIQDPDYEMSTQNVQNWMVNASTWIELSQSTQNYFISSELLYKLWLIEKRSTHELLVHIWANST